MNTSETLRQLDQTLIALLSDRISLLATLETPSRQEQLANYQSQLTQAGVPAYLWDSIVTHCMAALANAPSRHTIVEPRNITVVGGRGLMGCFFVDRLSAGGHNVSVLEYDGWEHADRLLGGADLVLLCVPLKATVAVVRRVAPYLSPTTTLADIASTKVSIMQTMMECHSGPVMGLHPMFGPGPSSFLGQKVVTCPGRDPEASQWLLDLIEADGGKLISCTPDEHDRMMVAVQAIRFFANFTLGAFLAEEGIDIERSLEFASPLYRIEINTVSRLLAQSAALYIDILLASDERCEAIKRLVKTSDRLAKLLAQGNRAALIEEFETAHKAFGDSPRALEESNHVISHLSTFLAANAMKTRAKVEPIYS
ncbi:bifunctional chorismate mutase/prephenate dehydrogenase [Stenomitos frigidus]|uniref:Bifunctional chorismate mutase/prephenate dehydrogenase n=1 Tax=Stenomitos frigidus ULC18 TaxID=2107698 RepID=A0A2T1DX71_9CYAN|nr:bifunctional chorismate mutase/prephenate dehydrogenase [Stenomitos frigidus]PSB25106.1 bifunctional chorismate mutase/prephenate dehydrogenase [Stenomitos frigidus ULC18]